MKVNTLFYLSLLLFSGLFFGRIVKKIKLPNVTGYLIAGLLIGPYFFRLVPSGVVTDFELISEMALAFIAFSIGAEFKLSYLRKVGLTPVIIALFAALSVTVLVTVILTVMGFDFQLALLLGAIGSATAPAATIMVVREYRAHGPVTDTLMSVVAIDDAIAIIAFGFSIAVVNSMRHPDQTSVILSILLPIAEIIGSMILGFFLGIMFRIPFRFFSKDTNRLNATLAFVFLGSSLASMFDLSPLLLCMCMGATVINIIDSGEETIKLVDHVTEPIFLMFFVVSGMELDLSVLPQIGLIGVMYVLLRMTGKVAGAYLGGVVMKTADTVKHFLGPTLLPQAGVAIGLSLIAANAVPEYGQTIRAVILSGTFVFELIGPVATKLSLKKAGEIT